METAGALLLITGLGLFLYGVSRKKLLPLLFSPVCLLLVIPTLQKTAEFQAFSTFYMFIILGISLFVLYQAAIYVYNMIFSRFKVPGIKPIKQKTIYDNLRRGFL